MPKKALAPSVTSRDSKGLKFMSIVEAAYNKAQLSEEEAQRVNDTPGLSDLIGSFIAENRMPNKFRNEEVASSFGYLSGYTKPIEISDQIDILRSHWPRLNPDPAMRYMREAYPALKLPEWVEGPFAIIRPGFFSDKYGEELEEVLKALAKAYTGKFVNYREGLLGPDHLRQSQRTLAELRALMEAQPEGDILISPVQFGIRHRGRSVRRAREVFIAQEYGVGAKDGGTMLLTNPNRLQQYNDLWMDLAGDEYTPDADGQFGHCRFFDWYDGGIGFDNRWADGALASYGSVSAFRP